MGENNYDLKQIKRIQEAIHKKDFPVISASKECRPSVQKIIKELTPSGESLIKSK
jgi:protoheme ferro-lyase